MGSREVWEIIDNLVNITNYVEVYRLRLVELGFTEDESYDMIEHFVGNKIKRNVEEQ